MNFKIGILGLDPETTALYLTRLIDRFYEKDLIRKNQDFPQFIVNNIPGPAMVKEVISQEDLSPYLQGAKELNSLGCNLIAMICNTFYLFFDAFQQTINTPIIDLREEIFQKLKQANIQRIAVFGTPETMKGNLYNFSGIKSIPLTAADETELNDILKKYIINNDRENQKDRLLNLSGKYLERGAQSVILGCTEFGIMLTNSNINKIDSLAVLTDSVIREFEQYKISQPD